jgi:hypothetical protein
MVMILDSAKGKKYGNDVRCPCHEADQLHGPWAAFFTSKTKSNRNDS